MIAKLAPTPPECPRQRALGSATRERPDQRRGEIRLVRLKRAMQIGDAV
jgi:hypothetical protein